MGSSFAVKGKTSIELEDVKRKKSIVEKYLTNALFTCITPKGTLRSQTYIGRTQKI